MERLGPKVKKGRDEPHFRAFKIQAVPTTLHYTIHPWFLKLPCHMIYQSFPEPYQISPSLSVFLPPPLFLIRQNPDKGRQVGWF